MQRFRGNVRSKRGEGSFSALRRITGTSPRRCGDVAADGPEDVAAQEEWEEPKKHLALPQALDDDITIECVSTNSVGRSRDVFFLCKCGNKSFFFRLFSGQVTLSPFQFPRVPVGGACRRRPWGWPWRPWPCSSCSLSSWSGGSDGSVGRRGHAFVLLLAIIIIIITFVLMASQQPKYEIRWKIVESCSGNNYTFVDPSLLPYNNLKWEFPRDKLRLGNPSGHWLCLTLTFEPSLCLSLPFRGRVGVGGLREGGGGHGLRPRQPG